MYPSAIIRARFSTEPWKWPSCSEGLWTEERKVVMYTSEPSQGCIISGITIVEQITTS